MNWTDYVIIAIVVFSALIGLVRGFVREIFSLATWIGAFVLAVIFASRGAGLLAPYIAGEQLRLVLAFAGLFALTLVVGIALGHFAGRLVERSELTGADRGLGLFFGIARGYVAAAALVLLGSFTHLPEDAWWQQSRLIPFTQPVAAWMAAHLPSSELARHTTS